MSQIYHYDITFNGVNQMTASLYHHRRIYCGLLAAATLSGCSAARSGQEVFGTPEQAIVAVNDVAGTNDPAEQQKALNSLQEIVSTQAPVIPLLYGAAWYEYSTKNYTGWPTADNQYNNPVPNSPYILNTILHLKPVS